MSNFDNNPYAVTNVTDDYGWNEKPVHVPDYLVASILVTIFCCLPFGIAAIFASSKARSLKAIGQYQAALEHSNKAKTYVIISVVGGLIILGINIAIQMAEMQAGP